MTRVGVRQLKEKLSSYLKLVRSGEKIVVTDRKREVAIIVPYGIAPDEEKVLKMVNKGIADWSGGRPTGMVSRISPKGRSVSEAVLEDRR